MQTTNKLSLLTLIFLMSFLAGFGIDLYAPSLPAMTNYFHTQASYTQLALAIYLLGAGIGQPIAGTLSDSYGRKIPLIIGVLLYILASLSALLAGNVTILIIMRFLQGIGGATCSAINKALLTDTFSTEELPKYTTFMTISWSLGPIIAPVIGGYLQHYFGWQSTFALQGLQSTIILLFVFITFKETNHNLMPFTWSVIASTYLTIFKHRIFIGAALCMLFMYSLIIVFNVISPFLIQGLLHYSAMQYGNIALVIGLAYFSGTLLNRILLNYYSMEKIFMTSIYLSLLISIVTLVSAFFLLINIWLITIPSFLLFFLGGLIFPNCMAKSMTIFREASGAAGAVIGSIFIVGTFIVGYAASLLGISSIFPMCWVYLILTLGYVIVKFCLLKTA